MIQQDQIQMCLNQFMAANSFVEQLGVFLNNQRLVVTATLEKHRPLLEACVYHYFDLFDYNQQSASRQGLDSPQPRLAHVQFEVSSEVLTRDSAAHRRPRRLLRHLRSEQRRDQRVGVLIIVPAH